MESFNSLATRSNEMGDSSAAHLGMGRAVENAPLRVFLVEDSPALRERLIDFLAEPGKVDVIGFADTEAEAVRRLSAEEVNVAIIDLGLKEGTGIGVIESVGALRDPQPIIVVLTNYSFPEFETACRERGARYFFDKSTQFGTLKVLLHSLQRSRS